MASGDTMGQLDILSALLPASNGPQFATRNNHWVLQFDTTTQETCYFQWLIPSNYGGGGLDFLIWSMAASATSGNIGFGISIERMDAATDLDADSFATEQGTAAAVTVSATSGQPTKQTVTCSSGANMDSAVAGDMVRIRVRRDVANDTATGDAQLMLIEIREH
jgi:hypothetical protein